jgi:hypothetical protein
MHERHFISEDLFDKYLYKAGNAEASFLHRPLPHQPSQHRQTLDPLTGLHP